MAREVGKEVFHKDNMEDVLVYDVTTLAPASLSPETYQNVFAMCTEDEQALLSRYYRKGLNNYILAGLPESLEPSTESEDLPAHLQNYYTPVTTSQGAWLNLSADWIPRQVHFDISSRHENLCSFPSSDELQRIANLIYQSPEARMWAGESSFLRNDCSNYYFYRKHHEHVPGLMLIEAARQAMYSHVYGYSGHKRGEVSISMNSLTSNFVKYTESTYPVEIVVQNTDPEKFTTKCAKIDLTASLYQNASMVAQIRLQGAVMKIPLFKRLRNISFPESEWFSPLHRVNPCLLLFDMDGKHCNATLRHMSMAGLIFEDKDNMATSQLTSSLSDGVIFVDGIGMVRLPLKGRVSEVDWASSQFHIAFGGLSPKHKAHIREVIKQCTKFNEEVTQKMSQRLRNYKNSSVDKEYDRVADSEHSN